ncbi:hypothetical protein VIBNISO65_260051 [Vibrio nigripulchritudo SO65]|nr:hypothetical protein VIBNIAM115_830042 [Vibrio nigripulchritudo AM115]CCN41607.1 hypothetical protein VIBNIFTn2_1640043 [Vibrio nigripulchritudo FTn2]CCN64980.1 hypothetical protein VIBNIPon4_300052 [Vibrio nigripulchritudo POn4]CCN77540.1 hypothetical protein VIBNISO65_260051 [Vibrio nigripulchritudo SO65]
MQILVDNSVGKSYQQLTNRAKNRVFFLFIFLITISYHNKDPQIMDLMMIMPCGK